jgi:hypothetical protein
LAVLRLGPTGGFVSARGEGFYCGHVSRFPRPVQWRGPARKGYARGTGEQKRVQNTVKLDFGVRVPDMRAVAADSSARMRVRKPQAAGLCRLGAEYPA